jgi:uncharacterized membrane protein
MDIFIRHQFGERKNIVGHRWYKQRLVKKVKNIQQFRSNKNSAKHTLLLYCKLVMTLFMLILCNNCRIFQLFCSQFHQRYTRVFFVQIFQQSQNVTRKTTFVQKIRTYNVDVIDT